MRNAANPTGTLEFRLEIPQLRLGMTNPALSYLMQRIRQVL
jgi:hypothetical protein